MTGTDPSHYSILDLHLTQTSPTTCNPLTSHPLTPHPHSRTHHTSHKSPLLTPPQLPHRASPSALQHPFLPFLPFPPLSPPLFTTHCLPPLHLTLPNGHPVLLRRGCAVHSRHVGLARFWCWGSMWGKLDVDRCDTISCRKGGWVRRQTRHTCTRCLGQDVRHALYHHHYHKRAMKK